MRTPAHLLLVLILVSVSLFAAPCPVVASELGLDFPLVSGHFYAQASGISDASRGFKITDENGVSFWTAYQQLGGPAELGYPISRRFVWDGMVVQATEKAVLQWQRDTNRVVVVNLLDRMHDLGLDDWLHEQHSIPRPLGAGFDDNKTWDEIVGDRLSLLDADSALRARYNSLPSPARSLELYGLPTSRVEDMGSHYAVRLQRAVMRHWKVDGDGARAGEVTVANVGELARSAGLFPSSALEPISVQASSLPDLEAPSPVADQVAEAARSAVVKILIPDQGFGSGFVFSDEGHVLTSQHVVSSYPRVLVQFADGRVLPGAVLGGDTWTDVAVVKVDYAAVASLPLGNSDCLEKGQEVITLGYAPLFERTPEPRFGQLLDLMSTTVAEVKYGLVRSDVYLQPGDSGGPLLNLRGEVVGINAAIRLVGGENGRIISTSVALDRVKSVVSQIITEGKASRPWLGIAGESSTLHNPRGPSGVLVVEVGPDSPASRAGLRVGHVIVGAAGQRVMQATDLQLVLSTHTIGDEIELLLVGPNSEQSAITVQLGALPE